MEISLIASVLLPLLLKAGKTAAKKVMEKVGEDSWEQIKKIFSKEKDQQILSNLDENPKDPNAKPIVLYKLENFLEENPTIASKLGSAINSLQTEGQIDFTQMTMSGNDNIGIQKNSGIIKINKR
jgi:hypothetical protein